MHYGCPSYSDACWDWDSTTIAELVERCCVYSPKGTAVAQIELVADADIAAETVAAMQANSREVPEQHRRRLWATTSTSGNRLTQEEQQQLFALCLEYENLFARGADDFGRSEKLTHKINTEGSPPIRQQARRVPPFREEEVKKLLDEMLMKEPLGITSCLSEEERWLYPVLYQLQTC